LTPAGGAAVFAADFNYGFAAYDSFNQRVITLKMVQAFGRAGANDTGFDIQLLHHKSTGWTYSAAAFVPNATPICSLVGDYGVDNDLVNGEKFRWERDIITFIDGTANEGFLVRIITTSNKAVDFMNVGVFAETVPNRRWLNTSNQAINLVYNGTYWMGY
jgi:hypothetical protein